MLTKCGQPALNETHHVWAYDRTYKLTLIIGSAPEDIVHAVVLPAFSY